MSIEVFEEFVKNNTFDIKDDIVQKIIKKLDPNNDRKIYYLYLKEIFNSKIQQESDDII